MRKLQIEKYDKHYDVIEKWKSLIKLHLFNVSKISQLFETTPFSPTSVSESEVLNVAGRFLVIKLKYY